MTKPALFALFASFAAALFFCPLASADTATYQKFAISRFKEDRAVRAALAEVKSRGYELDAEPTASLLGADCTSQVCKPTFLVTLGATSIGGAYSRIIVIGALIGSTTHFGTEVVLLPTDKMSRLPELMKVP